MITHNIKTIFCAEHIMGISVSESTAVRQMAEEKERKRLESKEKIRSQLASPIPINVSPSSDKENKSAPNSKNPSFNSSLPKPENHNKHALVRPFTFGQKKDSEDQTPPQKISSHPDYKEKKEITEFVSKYLSKDSIPSKETETKLPPDHPYTDVTSGLPLGQQAPRQELISQSVMVKQSKKNAMKRISSLSSPQVLMREMRQKGEFDVFDWQIPSDKDILVQARNIEVLPSMTLILSNKFNQNVSCMDECTDREQFHKNRRQIMRDLLSGRRQSAQQKLMPDCGCGGTATSTKTFELK